MIRIGIDIVEISRLENALSRWPKMAGRVFTETELQYAFSKTKPGQHLAARFAAKEAAFKALGAGWPSLSWHDVEVASQGGAPSLRLSGKAARLADGASTAVSLAHDGGLAVAQVLMEAPVGG